MRLVNAGTVARPAHWRELAGNVENLENDLAETHSFLPAVHEIAASLAELSSPRTSEWEVTQENQIKKT